MNNQEDDIFFNATQQVGGRQGINVPPIPESKKRRVILVLGPEKMIPIVFLPGIMGSHLRMSKKRQEEMKKARVNQEDNIAWRPDSLSDTLKRRKYTSVQRQLNFDPDETEVEYYHWTSDGERFDKSQANDERHSNVPDDLPGILPLMAADVLKKSPLTRENPSAASPAQKARWRGWSEILYTSYGNLLVELETRLNNVVTQTPAEEKQYGRPLPELKEYPSYVNVPEHLMRQNLMVRNASQNKDFWDNMCQSNPNDWGQVVQGAALESLTKEGLEPLKGYRFPVHAMGYNWLKSNGEQAKAIADRIRALIARYNELGYECPGVVIVTHSMGGILSRALIHKDYGGLTEKEVLGICHGVMPTHGAAATYKRMRTGFEGINSLNPVNIISAYVLGANGADVTPVLANAQGALELLPNAQYGAEWLEVQDEHGNSLMCLPTKSGPDSDVTSCIYNADEQQWWRLINPAWVDPAEKYKESPGGALPYAKRFIRDALGFHKKINATFHPTTYAHYGNDPNRASYGKVIWQVYYPSNVEHPITSRRLHQLTPDTHVMESRDGLLWISRQGFSEPGNVKKAGHPSTWKLRYEDGYGKVVVETQAGDFLILKMKLPQEAGDQTVPAKASASQVQGVVMEQRGYEHQGSYQDKNALQFTVYSVVKIISKHLQKQKGA
jgi:hypothetical protein